MKLDELTAEAHAIAVQKGWYDNGGPSALEKHMLMVTEVAEASEKVRNKKPALYFVLPGGNIFPVEPSATGINYAMCALEEQGLDLSQLKPEGEAAELVDVVIRFGDYFGSQGWDAEAITQLKMNFNRTRPTRHGDKAL